MRRWKILIPATIIASLFTYFIVIGDADIKHGGKKNEYRPNERETVHSDELKKDNRVPHEGSRPSRGGEYKPTSVQLQETFVGKPMKTLTIQCNIGRLGNQMSSYATLYGIARYNNRLPEGLPCNMKHLLPVFEVTAAVKWRSITKLKTYNITDTLREQDRHIPEDTSILTGYRYPESHTFYHEFKEEIRKEFTFKPGYNRYADKTLSNIGRNRNFNVYVGVHVRRTDYCWQLRRYRGRMFDVKYLVQAMDYFRQKYHPVLFVVVSDDRGWCRAVLSSFKDVIIAPNSPTAAHDLAIMSHCNHSIITLGTFGYWGAYLAGGETVYFTDFLSPDSPLLRNSPNRLSNYPPEWVGISTTPKGFWNNFKLQKCP